jgi:mannose-6-phosphate isomerase-like protein (cupin superfamily)
VEIMAVIELRLEDARRETAPDGSSVFVLTAVDEAGTAVFELPPETVARPVVHPRVQEVWFVLSGEGRLWRRSEDGTARVTDLVPGTSLTIPRRTAFQFRSDGAGPLRILGVTAPPWQGATDAEVVDQGEWPPTI